MYPGDRRRKVGGIELVVEIYKFLLGSGNIGNSTSSPGSSATAAFVENSTSVAENATLASSTASQISTSDEAQATSAMSSTIYQEANTVYPLPQFPTRSSEEVSKYSKVNFLVLFLTIFSF